MLQPYRLRSASRLYFSKNVITVSHRNLVIGQNNLLIIGYSVSLLWENAMNNQQPTTKSNPLLASVLKLIVLLMFCNTAAAIDSSVKSNTTTMPNTECLLNWAQPFYPSLFSSALQEVQLSDCREQINCPDL